MSFPIKHIVSSCPTWFSQLNTTLILALTVSLQVLFLDKPIQQYILFQNIKSQYTKLVVINVLMNWLLAPKNILAFQFHIIPFNLQEKNHIIPPSVRGQPGAG